MTNPDYCLSPEHKIWQCFVNGRPITNKSYAPGFHKGGYQADANLNVWKDALCREMAKDRIAACPFDFPMAMSLLFYMPTTTKEDLTPHMERPDCDNLAKPVADVLELQKKTIKKALPKAGIIKNDCLIYSETITKVWVREMPGVMIRLYSCVAAIDLGGGGRRL